jgi:hypothetical protein
MPLPHNPRTGEAVSVKALPHFKAGRGLRLRSCRPFVALICLCLAAASNAMAAGEFDGAYTGTYTVLPGSSPICGPIIAKMIISDNKVTYAHTPVTATTPIAIIVADISGDGSFHGSGVRRTSFGERGILELSGKVTAGGIEADTWAARCQYHLSLKKITDG